MRILYILISSLILSTNSFSQCDPPMLMGGIVCQGYGVQIGCAWTDPSWTYSWSPSTGLNNPFISNPTASPQHTTDYTLTLTTNCGSFEVGTVTVLVREPVTISPSGPITYYNQYETTQELTFNSDEDGVWYVDNEPVTDFVSIFEPYNLELTGLPNKTYYVSMTNGCFTSNTVTVNYIGCNDVNDYPVNVPATYCVSQLPLTLEAPSLGLGTNYSWYIDNPTTVYYFSNQSGNQIELNASSPYPSEGIYTKSSLGGEAIYMYYVIGGPICRTMSPQQKENLKNLTIISPNPASNYFIVRSKVNIINLEIIDQTGKILKTVSVNDLQATVSTSFLSNGIYFLKINYKDNSEIKKIAVSK